MGCFEINVWCWFSIFYLIATNDRGSRIVGLAQGDSAQYSGSGDKWHLKNSGELEGQIAADWKVTVGGNFDVTLSKLKLSNGSDELVDLIVQTLDALIAEPFIVNKATFTALKTKVEAFKV